MSTKIDNFRLTEIRSQLRIPQGDVAKHLGVSPALVSRWEKGERHPSTTQLLALAGLFGVPYDYLVSGQIRASFQCRSLVKQTAAEKKAYGRAFVAAESQVHALAEVNRRLDTRPLSLSLLLNYSRPQLAEQAREVRRSLQLNDRVTLSELKEALRQHHVHVFEWHLPRKLSGFSYRGVFTIIFLNRDHNAERRLFTLAHELAHLLYHLGRGDEQTAVSVIASKRDTKEKEADAFASELLLPEAEVETMVKRHGKATLRNPMVLATLANKFHVSREALFTRLVPHSVFSWARDKRKYFRTPAPSALPEVLVTNPEKQVDRTLMEGLMELYWKEEISGGKFAEWSCTPRHVAEQFLSEKYFEEETMEEILEMDSGEAPADA